MDFKNLQEQILFTHNELYLNAVKSINIHLSIRNWLIGYYIVEFEQEGEDRAKYGSTIIKELSKNIQIKGLGETNLKQCRKFFIVYPEISQSVTDLFKSNTIYPVSLKSQLMTVFSFSQKSKSITHEQKIKTLGIRSGI